MEVFKIRLMKAGSFIPKFLLATLLWYPMIYAFLLLNFGKYIVKHEKVLNRFIDYVIGMIL